MKRPAIKIIVSVGLLLIFLILLNHWIPGFYIANPVNQIKAYAKTHEQFTFGEALSFNWDVAYIDGQVYGRGEELKDKYDLEFNVSALGREEYQRLIFFKNGKMIKEGKYDILHFYMPMGPEEIFPDTVFVCEWEREDILLLTPLNS